MSPSNEDLEMDFDAGTQENAALKGTDRWGEVATPLI